MLVDSRAGPRIAGAVQLRELMNKPERNKLGKAAGLLLNIAQQHQVTHPVLLAFGMPIHHRRRSAYAEPVRSFDHVEPLGHFELYAFDLMANIVVEDFRRGSRQRS